MEIKELLTLNTPQNEKKYYEASLEFLKDLFTRLDNISINKNLYTKENYLIELRNLEKDCIDYTITGIITKKHLEIN